jgi:hypothetical protein
MQLSFCYQSFNLLLASLTGHHKLQRVFFAAAFLTGIGLKAAMGRVVLARILPAFEEKLV